ncbi:DEAD/DEAH box helicase [Paratractidigestivibacter sp.]|uniref:DEAD/DEAH box helicase n=1 Tax=Paratractidigestivibacter sp. TaxID=2847316 RepID=UPI002ABD641F|nr:DEAD/DEAH box helicase [Paratractidigestivibacter sp.]
MNQSTSPAVANGAAAFSDLGLSLEVFRAVSDLGYTEPTPIQASSIPLILQGRDLLAAAQTGTGKTAAFLLPTMSLLGHAGRGHGPLMLVITPTRELAQQITDVCSVIQKRTRHMSLTVVGGVGYEPQKAALRRGCDILVATPGRLVDLIDQGDARLGEVEVLVLDEADRMLDMGFLPQMRKIVAQTPAARQTLLFSATLDESAIGGIKDLVRDPETVEIARKGAVAETIDQYVLPVSLEAKNALLADVLKSEGPSRAIVFTRTKHRADACCRRLRRAGVTCAPIHGDRKQSQRERALEEFRAGKIDVLVATDVLARGIDVSDVRYVVNFDVPGDPEDYIHRIGRTGRAGETGWALTFVTVNDAEDLVDIEKLMGMKVPAYKPKSNLETGEEPPALGDVRAALAGRRAKKGKKKTRAAEPTKAQLVKEAKTQPSNKPKVKTIGSIRNSDMAVDGGDGAKKKRRHRHKRSPEAAKAPAAHRRVGDQKGRKSGIH